MSFARTHDTNTNRAVSCFMEELLSFCVTMQRETCNYSLTNLIY